MVKAYYNYAIVRIWRNIDTPNHHLHTRQTRVTIMLTQDSPYSYNNLYILHGQFMGVFFCFVFFNIGPCWVGSVGSVSASRTVGHEFASRPGHTKDHHKNGTNCLPA